VCSLLTPVWCCGEPVPCVYGRILAWAVRQKRGRVTSQPLPFAKGKGKMVVKDRNDLVRIAATKIKRMSGCRGKRSRRASRLLQSCGNGKYRPRVNTKKMLRERAQEGKALWAQRCKAGSAICQQGRGGSSLPTWQDGERRWTKELTGDVRAGAGFCMLPPANNEVSRIPRETQEWKVVMAISQWLVRHSRALQMR